MCYLPFIYDLPQGAEGEGRGNLITVSTKFTATFRHRRNISTNQGSSETNSNTQNTISREKAGEFRKKPLSKRHFKYKSQRAVSEDGMAKR